MLKDLNRTEFFKAFRSSGVFGVALTANQVIGIESIIDAAIRANLTDTRKVSAILARVAIETGRLMIPIKETVMAYHKDRNPSDAEVIKRLDTAFAKGKLPWVSEPYWRGGAFGRGQIQVTHHRNYQLIGTLLKIPLGSDYSLALDPKISADIAVKGMLLGVFRKGHNLERYFNDKVEDPINSNRIVNGQDGKDELSAKYYYAFKKSLQVGQETITSVVTETAPKKTWWQWFFS